MIEIKDGSETAFIVAEFRAEENHASEPLYRDKIVQLFLNAESKQVAAQVAQSFPPVKEMVKLRTRYFDDVLVQQLTQGYQQVVILGSGLDTRAVRMATPNVRYFEIDRAATLQLKAERLAAHGIAAKVTYIPGDYVKDDLTVLLKNNHFDFQLPTYFLWEDKVTYLKRADIIAVLDTIRNHIKRFQLSIDYMSQQVIANIGSVELNDYIEQLKQRDAPWITGFKDIARFSRGLGLDAVEICSAAQLHDRYRPQMPRPSPLFEFYFVCTLARSSW
ncbi:MAG TPA: class I SAM-dependent methyltransferase [Trichocoleus sp.]|jgi:methyltransferase (TIGR00027 family)